MPNLDFTVTLSTHAPRMMFRLAEGLSPRGVLNRIYTIYPRFKLSSYRIPPDRIRSFYFFGALKYANRRLGNLIPGMDDVSSFLFGRLVALDLRKPEGPWFFHAYSGYCEDALKRAKALGAITVVERGCPHIDFQKQLVAEEQSRLLGRPVIPEERETYERMKREYDLADYIFLPSRYSQKSFLERGYSASKVLVVPLCNEKATTPPPEPKKLKKFTVLCIGGHFYRKGIYYILKAWQELDLKDAELLLRSDIPKEFPELANVPGVTYVPHVSEEEIIRLYQQAHVFVLPSIDEGFGIVTVEALAAGLPVIVTKNVGSGDIIEEGKDGFIVPIRDVGALKDRITFFYEHPEKVREMGNAALGKAKEYSHEKFTERMIAAYNQMIS
ncbi:MAG: glycosyltransferase family 4 protein [Candidatus Jorgensenbacteria bacterium]